MPPAAPSSMRHLRRLVVAGVRRPTSSSLRAGTIRRRRHALRGPTPDDASFFRSALSRPERSVLAACPSPDDPSGGPRAPPPNDDDDPLEPYNRDWTGRHRGRSPLVLRPQSASDVSSILRYCNEHRIGVVPRGGNTGLCGGATPVRDELVLSLEDLDDIHGLDEHSGVLTCDAGCVLEDLHSYAADRGRLFPLDVGAKGSCQIGGNVSTNAGGQYFFRFGGLHSTVAGMEVVLPSGDALRLNMEVDEDGGVVRGSTNRKDNTGYDLKHVFVGGEGTLGVVTKVAVACPPLPSARNAALLACGTYDDVLGILRAAQEELGEVLSAAEYMDSNTLESVRGHGLGGGADRLLRDLLRDDDGRDERPAFLLVETRGSNAEHDASKMDSFLTRLHDGGLVSDGRVAQDATQLNEMWRIREACNPSVAREGCVYKYDVSVPVQDYAAVAREVEDELLRGSSGNGDGSAAAAAPPELRLCLWGHVADGNAHVNCVIPGRFEVDPDLEDRIDAAVYGAVRRRGGSISAEHGIGLSKRMWLGRVKGEEGGTLGVMRGLKRLLDPRGIMNPGKVLPPEEGEHA